jgi:hypothetical protein
MLEDLSGRKLSRLQFSRNQSIHRLLLDTGTRAVHQLRDRDAELRNINLTYYSLLY